MKLYESVAFDEPSEVTNASGTTEIGWTERLTARADFRYLRGGEKVLSSRLQGVQPVVATVRLHSASSAITTDWRMRDTRRGDEYNIRSIVPSDNRLYLEITAERGVAV